MEIVTAVVTGIALAACAGLRAFLPLFAAGLAARCFHWDIAPAMSWLSSDAALIAFGLASGLEIASDKIPIVDHILDAGHTFVGPIAGGLVAFSSFFNLEPMQAAILALLAGVPIAGGVHAIAATSRLKSTMLTAGLGNPFLSLFEDFLVVAGIVIAFLLPLLSLVVVVVVIYHIARRRRRAPVV